MSDFEQGSTVGGSLIITQANLGNHTHNISDIHALGNSAYYNKSDSIYLNDSNTIATSAAVNSLRTIGGVASADKWTTAITITIAGSGKSVNGSGNVAWSLDDLQLNASLTTNGYQRLPSGLIVQWGQATFAYRNSNNVVTFPIAFPNASLHGWSSLKHASSQSGLWVAGFVDNTKTQANYYGMYTNDGRDYLTTWFVLGY